MKGMPSTVIKTFGALYKYVPSRSMQFNRHMETSPQKKLSGHGCVRVGLSKLIKALEILSRFPKCLHFLKTGSLRLKEGIHRSNLKNLISHKCIPD